MVQIQKSLQIFKLCIWSKSKEKELFFLHEVKKQAVNKNISIYVLRENHQMPTKFLIPSWAK